MPGRYIISGLLRRVYDNRSLSSHNRQVTDSDYDTESAVTDKTWSLWTSHCDDNGNQFTGRPRYL